MSLGNEAVEGSKMGTQLIMFVAIVAIALAAFLVGKGLVNSGLDNMETTVGKVNDSRFSDYNNKVVRGRALKQAIDNFANEEVAILVNNLAFQGTSQTGSNQTVIKNSVGADNLTKTSYSTIATSENGGETQKDLVGGYATTGKESTGVTFINYNAVLGAKGSDGKNVVAQGPGKLAVSDLYKDLTTGNYVFLNDFVTSKNGDVQYYLVTTPLSKKGDAQYVADSASYQANLIKNSSGEIMGIVFIQRKIS